MQLLKSIKLLSCILLVILSTAYAQELTSNPMNGFEPISNLTPRVGIDITGNNTTSAVDSLVLSKINGQQIEYVVSYTSNGQIDYYLEKADEQYRYSYTYNEHDDLLEIIIELLAGGDSYQKQKYSYEYNSDGSLSGYIMYEWTLDWVEYSKVTYDYNEAGERISTTAEFWAGTSWKDDWKLVQEYDSKQNLIAQTWYLATGLPDRPPWTEDYRVLYEYDDDGKILTKSTQMWYSEWEDQTKSTYTYDSMDKLDTLNVYYYDFGAWFLANRHTYEYDSNSRLISKLREQSKEFDPNNEELIKNSRINYVYDVSGNGKTTTYEKWSNNTWEPGEGYIGFYTSNNEYITSIGLSDAFSGNTLEIRYTEITDIEEPEQITSTFQLSQNYPNPFNPTTTIEFSLPQSGNVELTVYNLLGEKVTTLIDGYKTQGNHSIKFDGSNLSSGVYLYKIKTDNRSIVKKMLLVK